MTHPCITPRSERGVPLPFDTLNLHQCLLMTRQATEEALAASPTPVQTGQLRQLNYLLRCHEQHFTLFGLNRLTLGSSVVSGAGSDLYFRQLLHIHDHVTEPRSPEHDLLFDKELTAWAALHLS